MFGFQYRQLTFPNNVADFLWYVIIRPLKSKMDKEDEENTEGSKQSEVTRSGEPITEHTETEIKGKDSMQRYYCVGLGGLGLSFTKTLWKGKIYH